jgi:DNA gyrase subunit A
MGVTLFRVDKGEHVTSVFTVLEDEVEDIASAADDAIVPGMGVPGMGVPDTGVPDDGSTGDGDTPPPEEGNDG